jgi:predicted transcriptional regulator
VDDIDDTPTPAREDAATESAVLHHLLALHPIQVTIDELAREIDDKPEDFSRRDAIERAVRDLVGVGLLHRQDSFVLPSHAALRFNELLDV